MSETASIKDVARAAGVSTATVSNVLNRPTTVAGRTRERVLSVIEDLRYVRNQQAASLRLGKPGGRCQKPKPEALVHPLVKAAGITTSLVECSSRPVPVFPPREPASGAIELWQHIPVGSRVQVLIDGLPAGSGLAEGSLLDGSGIWVRYDDGSGRRLLLRCEEVSLTEASPGAGHAGL